MLPTDSLHNTFGRIATPACFAVAASGGRWRLVRHLHLIDRAVVETIQGGGASILVIEAPPRHGKSELISRYLPAWFLGVNPDKRVMLAGYGAGFAGGWGRKAREILELHGPSWFGVSVRRDLRASANWGIVGRDGGMTTSGVGGPMTGRGADLLIIDDPVKNAAQAQSERQREAHWDWWQSTASTRLEPGGCCIVIATRWHEDDLSGRLIREGADGSGPQVRRLTLPALADKRDDLGRPAGYPLWPERWPLKELERIRRSRSRDWWMALYQQSPGQGHRNPWDPDYFESHIWATTWPERFETSAVAIDPAGGKPTGDDAAVVFVGKSQGAYWVDSFLGKLAPERLVAEALQLYDLWRPQWIGFESNGFQGLLGLEFDRQCYETGRAPLPMIPIVNRRSKQDRIMDIGSFLFRKRVRFRDNDDNRRLVRQLKEFPRARHDDGPDALAMALELVNRFDSEL
ncbi:MAG: terminase large subunit domain-containing protein [Planctomycetales bacterium]